MMEFPHQRPSRMRGIRLARKSPGSASTSWLATAGRASVDVITGRSRPKVPFSIGLRGLFTDRSRVIPRHGPGPKSLLGAGRTCLFKPLGTSRLQTRAGRVRSRGGGDRTRRQPVRHQPCARSWTSPCSSCRTAVRRGTEKKGRDGEFRSGTRIRCREKGDRHRRPDADRPRSRFSSGGSESGATRGAGAGWIDLLEKARNQSRASEGSKDPPRARGRSPEADSRLRTGSNSSHSREASSPQMTKGPASPSGILDELKIGHRAGQGLRLARGSILG